MFKFFRKGEKLRVRHEIQMPVIDDKLERKSFIDYILTEIRKATPGVKIQQLENDFLYRLTYSNLPEGCDVTMDLINVWNNYQRTGSINTLNEFISAHLTGYKNFMRDVHKGRMIDLEIVFPIIRGRENVKKLVADGRVMFEELSQELLMMYAENYPESFSFIPLKLPEEITSEQIKRKAFENLKKQGWYEPNETLSQNAGKILLFINDKQPYQAQFFLKEMRERYLGETIFISFPTRDFSVVYKPDIVHLDNNEIISDNLNIVKKITVDLFIKQPGPTSHVIHKITPDGLSMLV